MKISRKFLKGNPAQISGKMHRRIYEGTPQGTSALFEVLQVSLQEIMEFLKKSLEKVFFLNYKRICKENFENKLDNTLENYLRIGIP